MRPKESGKRAGISRRPLRIGLTGGLGAGKSRVLRFLAQKRIPTLQTDQVGHALLKRSGVRGALKRLFGKTILSPEGEVDRGLLGKAVFQDPSKRKELNNLLHPLVRREVAHWAKAQSRRRPLPPLVVVEVPLLFERGYSRWFDRTVSVSAPKRSRHTRLLGRGWAPGEIRLREASQWSQARKDSKADWVISNRGSLKSLEYSVEKWLHQIRSNRVPKH